MMDKCTHLVKTTSLLEAFVTNMRMKFSMSPTFQLLQIVNPFVRTILSAISSHTQLVMKESAGFITIVTFMTPMNVMSGRINVYLDLNILTWMIAAPLNLKKNNFIFIFLNFISI